MRRSTGPRLTSALLALALACGRTEPIAETLAVANDAGSPDAGRPDAGRSDAGVDGGTPDAGRPLDAGIPVSCANEPGPQTMQRCRQRVRFTRLTRSRVTCFVDVRLDVGDEGALEWDCGQPTGRAELRFPRARFTGVMNGARLDVCFGSEFDWSDGCRWTSAQAVSGEVTTGATLRLTYAEAPLPGESGCVVPCQATGEVVVLGP